MATINADTANKEYAIQDSNDRFLANIQRNGTYSVVPRVWGGVTSSKELRAIADVVDKFDIPTVKYTGGQRIDMLGVKKEDLPAVYSLADVYLYPSMQQVYLSPYCQYLSKIKVHLHHHQ